MDKFLPKLTALVRVLMSMAPPSEGLSVKELSFFDQSLNPSQQEAIRFALESPEVACIHGPPGELLSSCDVQFALMYVDSGSKVLERPIL